MKAIVRTEYGSPDVLQLKEVEKPTPKESRRGGRGARKTLLYNSPILIGGQLAGSWRRRFKKGAAIIEIAPFGPMATPESEAVISTHSKQGPSSQDIPRDKVSRFLTSR